MWQIKRLSIQMVLHAPFSITELMDNSLQHLAI